MRLDHQDHPALTAKTAGMGFLVSQDLTARMPKKDSDQLRRTGALTAQKDHQVLAVDQDRKDQEDCQVTQDQTDRLVHQDHRDHQDQRVLTAHVASKVRQANQAKQESSMKCPDRQDHQDLQDHQAHQERKVQMDVMAFLDVKAREVQQVKMAKMVRMARTVPMVNRVKLDQRDQRAAATTARHQELPQAIKPTALGAIASRDPEEPRGSELQQPSLAVQAQLLATLYSYSFISHCEYTLSPLWSATTSRRTTLPSFISTYWFSERIVQHSNAENESLSMQRDE